MKKDAARWYLKYKVLDLKIKGLNKFWKVTSVPWHVVSKIDLKRAKGLSWSDSKARPMIDRAFKAVDTEMARTRKLLPMARRRSDYYFRYLDVK